MAKQKYQNFLGIDIGKSEFVVSCFQNAKVKTFENNQEGFQKFYKSYAKKLKNGFTVLETTGGHELALLLYLCQLKCDIHRANTRQVKAFVRSLGQQAKTDKLDAQALALYAKERHLSLRLFKPNMNALQLFELAQGRRRFLKTLVQEKNRAQAPRAHSLIKEATLKMITLLQESIAEVDQKIQSLIEQSPELTEKQNILVGIPGVGPITARNLICYMPEIGSLNQKEVAALAGVAPFANESGLFKGRRRIKGGRQEVRTTLYMAAMAVTRTKSKLKDFYARLVARGKKPIVALVAVMRKIIVIANARLKEWAQSCNSENALT